jgi:hypothetical protein
MKEVNQMLKTIEAAELAVKFTVLMAIVAAVAFLSGCTATPDGIYIDETIWVYATNRIDKAVEKHGGSSSATTDTGRAGDDRAKEERDGSMVTPSDGTSKPVVADSFVADWRFGGFNGSRATEVPGCRIGSLRVTRSGLSYKWESGGCEALGASSREDYSRTLACAFYWDGTKWVGGKYDYVSTSRTSRTFENIDEGYGGWNASEFFGAKRHGFCIVSTDGKRRSNFIED